MQPSSTNTQAPEVGARRLAFVAILWLVLLAGAAGLIGEALVRAERHRAVDAPLGPILHALR